MMEAEVQAVLKTGTTTEPTLRAIFLSEQINRRHNGPLVTPWRLDDVPEDFLDAYAALSSVARDTVQRKRLETPFILARRKHPTYRKYVH